MWVQRCDMMSDLLQVNDSRLERMQFNPNLLQKCTYQARTHTPPHHILFALNATLKHSQKNRFQLKTS